MLKLIVRSIFSGVDRLKQWVEYTPRSESTNTESTNHRTIRISEQNSLKQPPRFKVVNLWDHLKFREGTQAHHVTQVLDFEEWTPMEEILRRVKELFGIEYQNERSLYPYLKTLVDSGLLESSVVGGKMRWKKKGLLISVEELDREIEVQQTPPISQPL